MSRRAQVYFFSQLAGEIWEDVEGYQFQYSKEYLKTKAPIAISHTLPLQDVPFVSEYLFAFFDGLIPEGWLLDVASESWKISQRDRMGLLLVCCKECIGAVSIVPIGDVE